MVYRESRKILVLEYNIAIAVNSKAVWHWTM
jgi:hypothetical protein